LVCQLIICIICGFLKSGKARAWLPKNQEGVHGGFSKVRFQKPERHGERHGGAFATCESGAFATCEKTRPAFQLARSHGPQGAEHCCACEVCLVSACVLCLRGLPGLCLRAVLARSAWSRLPTRQTSQATRFRRLVFQARVWRLGFECFLPSSLSQTTL